MHVEEILQRMDMVRPAGDGCWQARCPAHDDSDPSLSVKDLGDKVLIYCHAQCSLENITAAIGITVPDLFQDSQGGPGAYTDGVRLPDKWISHNKAQERLVEDMTILMLTVGVRVNRRKAGKPEIDPDDSDSMDEITIRETDAAHSVIEILNAMYVEE